MTFSGNPGLEAPVSQTPLRAWVSDLCQGMELLHNVDSFMTNVINGNFTIGQEINGYYAMNLTDDRTFGERTFE